MSFICISMSDVIYLFEFINWFDSSQYTSEKLNVNVAAVLKTVHIINPQYLTNSLHAGKCFFILISVVCNFLPKSTELKKKTFWVLSSSCVKQKRSGYDQGIPQLQNKPPQLMGATTNNELTTEPPPHNRQQHNPLGALINFTSQIFALDSAVVKHKNSLARVEAS